MNAFGTYVRTLERLYRDVTRRGPAGGVPEAVAAALDGEASRQLRTLVPVEELRAAGAFFTGTGLASRAAERLMRSATTRSRILDPACGAGDLLVACAAHLPIKRGFSETSAYWGRCLHGRDLQPEFVAAARYRLALAALARGAWPRGAGAASDADAFAQVLTGCGLSDCEATAQATHIIINPPFNVLRAPAGCEWASGGISAAALFMDHCLRWAAPGTRVVAILPDVLRSGERYQRWRDHVTAWARLEGIDLIGRFARWADVDVFLLELVITRTPDNPPDCWGRLPVGSSDTVGELFHVSVGPVVPFRHPEHGPSRRYLHARGVPAWAVFREVRERRRFNGTVHVPPFVVIRRTSRVGDKHRAVATVITGREPVAVENHLLVARPKGGGLGACERLLRSLKSAATGEWLDRRIRCRHLTVGAVREIPLLKEGV